MAREERQSKRQPSEARPRIAPRVFRSEATFKKIKNPGKIDKSNENIGFSGGKDCNRPKQAKKQKYWIFLEHRLQPAQTNKTQHRQIDSATFRGPVAGETGSCPTSLPRN